MSGGVEVPRVVRSGVGLWCALSAFLLVQTAFSWSGRSALEQQLISSHAAPAAQAGDRAMHLLLLNSGLAVAFAAGYAVFGVLVLTKRPWARIAVTALLAVQVVMMLGSLSLSLVNMIVLVLGCAAAACCWTKTAAEWVTGEHE